MEIISPRKYDRRRKLYLVLDCETATLPCANNYPAPIKKNIAIAKPLIYDLGWQVIDSRGQVFARKNFLITEIFSVPTIYNTAYYASKRPIYLEKLKNNEIILTDWKTATAELVKDLNSVKAVGAYNSMFDFKKAIPFTEQYINHLYSPDYQRWENFQNRLCAHIAEDNRPKNAKEFDPEFFTFRNISYPLFDLWGLSCEHLLNNDEYRQKCQDCNWTTASGRYFPTTAETTFRFVMDTTDFEEAHTAVDDSFIESQLFAMIMKRTKNHLEMGIEYFPFRLLGTVEQFLARV